MTAPTIDLEALKALYTVTDDAVNWHGDPWEAVFERDQLREAPLAAVLDALWRDQTGYSRWFRDSGCAYPEAGPGALLGVAEWLADRFGAKENTDG